MFRVISLVKIQQEKVNSLELVNQIPYSKL